MKKAGSLLVIGLTVLAGMLTSLMVIPEEASASGWNIKTVDSSGDVGYFTSISIDSNNHPHISYYDDTNGNLKYAYWDGNKWNIETVDSSKAVGWYTSIALDANGHPHISYCDMDNGNLKYAYWDGNKWNIETVDSSPWVGDYTSIVLDSNDHPHICYFELANLTNYELKYITFTGKEWKNETVDNVGNIGSDIGESAYMDVDSNNNPHIAYFTDLDGKKSIKYAYMDGNRWNIETVDEAGDFGGWVSMSLNSNNYPCISYVGISGVINQQESLKYAYWDADKWNIETVDTSEYVGWDDCLSLDSTGNPHISYYDVSNHALKYAYWDSNKWNIETVDNKGDVGEFTSIAVDSNGCPHISYYDSTNGDLKYAEWYGENNKSNTPGFSSLIFILAILGASTIVYQRKRN